ncbi:glycosyltransferase [Agrococcus sp. KRD186]|uniref:glycosyltransferase n=1 Tax=Agrococcus sp. KRD186 TaxID=2729730 RepID=UPI0019D199FB
MDDEVELDALLSSLRMRPQDTVLHMNWTNPIAQRTRNPFVAARGVWRFVRALTEAKRAGMTILWTVHNVLPHDARHRWVERSLHRSLSRLADTIHIMSISTAVAAAPEYRLPPDRTVRIPHPSYFGAYGPREDRAAARERLGIGADDLALLMLGQMRAYKGVRELIEEAGTATRQSGRVVLLLAGNATEDEAAVINALVEDHGVETVRQLSFIDAEAVPGWLAAADVVVLPYSHMLNSGSMMLAATFARPVLLPDDKALRQEHGDRGWVHWYARTPGGLRAAIEQLPVGDELAFAAALADAGRWTPQDAGTAFAGEVRALLARSGASHAQHDR